MKVKVEWLMKKLISYYDLTEVITYNCSEILSHQAIILNNHRFKTVKV